MDLKEYFNCTNIADTLKKSRSFRLGYDIQFVGPSERFVYFFAFRLVQNSGLNTFCRSS